MEESETRFVVPVLSESSKSPLVADLKKLPVPPLYMLVSKFVP